jgi:hypothetical protein
MQHNYRIHIHKQDFATVGWLRDPDHFIMVMVSVRIITRRRKLLLWRLDILNYSIFIHDAPKMYTTTISHFKFLLQDLPKRMTRFQIPTQEGKQIWLAVQSNKSSVFWGVTCTPLKDPSFWRNGVLPSSGWKNKLSKKQVWSESTIFWDITPCSPLRVNRLFGVTCHLLSRWFLAQLIYRPWRWKLYVLPKRRFTFNGLHGIISQKMLLFITITAGTSNLKV